ncbi:hypothetical protein L596_018354 [Steinernema carpocapsae]|nr:hypothetical protein L596_018354 [Steinernema carpocapsae]
MSRRMTLMTDGDVCASVSRKNVSSYNRQDGVLQTQTQTTDDYSSAVHKRSLQADSDRKGLESGGKLGESLMARYGISTMYELSKVSRSELDKDFPGSAEHVFDLARGVNHDTVKVKDKQKSIAVSKNFPGKASLKTVSELKKWLLGLIKELVKRLAEDQRVNLRTAQSLNCGFVMNGPHGRTLPLTSYMPDAIFNIVWSALKNMNKAADTAVNWEPPIVNVFLSASRFRDGVAPESRRITQWVYTKMDELEGRPPVDPLEEEEEDVLWLADDESSRLSTVSIPKSMAPTSFTPSAAGEAEADPRPSTSRVTQSRSATTVSSPRKSPRKVHMVDLAFDFSFLPPTFEEVDKEYFENMPENVQKGIKRHYQIKSAKDMEQKKRGDEEKPTAVKVKPKTKAQKRQNTNLSKKTAQGSQAKISKISTFFKPN